MKNFSHIISKLFYEPTLLTPMRHGAICHLLESKLAAGALQVGNFNGSPMDDAGNAPEADEPRSPTGTVIIPVHGTLVAHPEDIALSECGCAMEDLAAQIEMAEHDPRIERMIFDFRTPGGSVTMIPETGRKIASSRKETVAFTDSECCSGGLWLAAQCQKFYATQSSRVGSVGVYTMVLDMTKAMKQAGIKIEAVFAAKYKLLGASFRQLSDDDRVILQAGVDKIYAQFKEAMETHRVVDDKNFGNGLVFDGDDAAAMGFTDGVVEDMDDMIENCLE